VYVSVCQCMELFIEYMCAHDCVLVYMSILESI